MTRLLQQLVASSIFRNAILATILAAGILIGLETSPELVASHGPLLHTLDKAILAIFTLEFLAKAGAHGRQPWRYFQDPWNSFDFLIVAICWIPTESAHIAAVLRLARVLRVLRLVSALPKLQLLVNALLKSLPSMFYVVLLLSIHFYVYAVVGVFAFRDDSPEAFSSLGTAFLTLFQVVTMEGWVDVMNAPRAAHPMGSPLYFISFILLGTMIMLNLFIGVIMNGMTEAHEQQVMAEQKNASAGADGSTETELARLEIALRDVTERLAALRRSTSDQLRASEPTAPDRSG